ncbi:MAG: gliding motility-associated ABC transporter substrate-binding protein GldG [Bacteroidota bacterium]|nr:gliding motility-associated ABC transporter substrate-binding protein GldG [Bacteroidota bacterium]
MKNQTLHTKKLIWGVLLIIVLNFISQHIYYRFDLTHDKRYTLSDSTKELLNKIDAPIEFTILLQGKNLPAEFRRLQQETKQLLEEFKSINSNISFLFEDPLEGEENPGQTMLELDQNGFAPTNIPITKQGSQSIVRVFPWAIGAHLTENKSVRIPMLINNFGNSGADNIQKSVEQLEYAFADAISKLIITQKKNIAILKGNGQIQDKYLADWISHLKPYYMFGEFDLKNLHDNNAKVIENLDRFDLAVIAKPTQNFTEREKYLLDQYLMKGKKVIWLLDQVQFDLDSLNNQNRQNVALGKDLNLDDMLFRYGVRINYDLIEDYNAVPITLKDQSGQELPLPWLYSFMTLSKENHIINKSTNALKFEFANSIDTLENNIRKTVLAESSAMSRTVGVPQQINLFQFEDTEPYQGKPKITAVLLEGAFTSAYKNRVKPFDYPNYKDNSPQTQMIVISDGDLVNYMYANKRFLYNGYDNWTEIIYGNRDFLTNAVHYMLDDTGIINIRAKEVSLAFFDKEKLKDKYRTSQLITLGIPLVLLCIFGFVFNYIRGKKYTKPFKK